MSAPRYAVIGNPIAHSRSPEIHQAFAQQLGIDLVYEKRLAELGEFNQSIASFAEQRGQGLNVTVPFKTDAFELASDLSPRAKLAGAVNTLALLPTGHWFGDNTDGAGLVHDIQHNLGWEIHGKDVLILGAGGAVRGVLGPLLALQPRSLHIANRTAAKASDLAKQFSHLAAAGTLTGGGWHSPSGNFDLVINGTSASLSSELPGIAGDVVKNSCCYDMMYAAEPTRFLSWAKEHKALDCADGLGMLVEQAAESFELWHQQRPETIDVIAQIRQSM